MRERLAILTCIATLVCVTALSWLFAVRHNPRKLPAENIPQAAAERTGAANKDETHPGRLIIARENCLGCHSIEGIGNPRLPLEARIANMPPHQIEEWIAGTGAASNKLSAAVLRRKQNFQKIPKEEMEAMVDYLKGTSVP
jgi:mono/diheme cytochrome c family protein